MVIKSSKLKNVGTVALYTVLIGLSIGTWWIVVQPLPDTESEIYTRYNNFRMYEDGSYEAKNHDGTTTTGCVKGALCDDEPPVSRTDINGCVDGADCYTIQGQ